jgi:hypothetical protein
VLGLWTLLFPASVPGELLLFPESCYVPTVETDGPAQ